MALYIVSVPIGHPGDITLRAVKTFEDADFLICEEFKNGRKLLKQLNIEKELFNLNEHNEETGTEEIIQELLKGKKAALFSDCGTPLFADPGSLLVKRCHETGIKVIPIPGASSLMAALVVAGVRLDQFHYAGFLPRNTSDRRKEIRNLLGFNCPVIIYDAPYRLSALITDLKAELPGVRQVTLALSLTKPDEKVLFGTMGDLVKMLGPKPPKKEFVMILHPQILKKSKKHVKTRKRR
ncbi:MAG: 16S rRNA (cytidine(1402)-2'-O)-methyltransferase [Proteobacteria bacterium]|nr:16S rRNA (cytidine(1402)-2'-O)-methyltransferase [Pseudomonadota bacterium]